MGDIKRKRKLFSRPRKLYDRARIDSENVLVKQYGLKNKQEIWKARSFVSKLRRRAKNLIGADMNEQKIFFDRLNKMGITVADISDVLALTESDLLERRLQTFVVKKGLAKTPLEARQLIVHRKVLVDGGIVDVPSYLVAKAFEDSLSIKPRIQKEPATTPEEQALKEELVAEVAA